MNDLPPEILVALLRDELYPDRPVCELRRFRLLGRSWNAAYQQAMAPGAAGIRPIHPGRGGMIPVGFMCETDTLQGRAVAGLNVRDNFRPLASVFAAARTPRVVASSAGVFCVRAIGPAEFILWSPVDDDHIIVPLPPPLDGIPQDRPVGLHVDVVEGEPTAQRCTLILPYDTQDQMIHVQGGFLGAQIWNSNDGNWENQHVATLFEGIYEPQPNAISIGNRIYLQVSHRTVYAAEINGAEGVQHTSFDMPFDAVRSSICLYQGQIAACSLSAEFGSIIIWTRSGVLWQEMEAIQLFPIVNQFRAEFGSNTMGLRSGRAPETAAQVVGAARILAFYRGCGMLFVRHRGGIVRICLPDSPDGSNVKRLVLGQHALPAAPAPPPAISLACSSLVRLIPV